jgi:two-component system chemotaxis response regulator CheB
MSDREKTRVLVVDDSPLMCRVITDILNNDNGITVAGEARSGTEALLALASGKYDVCTLDVHMPGMSGLTVLKHIMIKSPLPTLMVSAFTSEGARTTFDSLRYGAVDFFHKPSRDNGSDMIEQARKLCAKVKKVARVQVSAARYLRLKPANRKKEAVSAAWNGKHIAVLRTSTGGYAALLSFLPMLQAPPAIPVIVSLGVTREHLGAFVNYIREFVACELVIPEGSTCLEQGKVYLLADNDAAGIEKEGEKWCMEVTERTDFTDMEGAIDLILFGIAEHFTEGAMFLALSGDGVQGLSGAKEIKRNGGVVLAQKPTTCLAPGLPRKIIRETGCETGSIPELVQKISGWGNG